MVKKKMIRRMLLRIDMNETNTRRNHGHISDNLVKNAHNGIDSNEENHRFEIND